MRTYLKNWVVLKSITDLKILHNYADWDFTGIHKNKEISPPAIQVDKLNNIVKLTYTISNGTTDDVVTTQDDIFLNQSNMSLPPGHQIQIIAKEGDITTDDETVQTDRLWT